MPVFALCIHFPGYREEAEEVEGPLKESIYDLLDEAGVAYKVVAIGLVEDEEDFDKLLDRQSPSDSQIGGFRSGDPDTSRKGALDAYPRSGQHRHKALIAIAKAGDHGLTYREVEESTGISNVWKRLSELRDGGWIYEAGERVVKNTGSAATIWKITEKAERHIETKERAGLIG